MLETILFWLLIIYLLIGIGFAGVYVVVALILAGGYRLSKEEWGHLLKTFLVLMVGYPFMKTAWMQRLLEK